jgi:small subunit ribosomal protein S1
MLTKEVNVFLQPDDMPQLDESWWAALLEEEAKEDLDANPVINFPGERFTDLDWEIIQIIYDNDEIITLKVSGYNRGGLLVQNEHIHGFLPVSHLVDMLGNATEEERVKLLPGYVGKMLQLKVIECVRSQDRVVFSERAALAGEGRRLQLFRTLHEGDRVVGTVTNVAEFGVFVDLGGVEGLIHLSELSWGRVHHPKDILQVGSQIDVLVLQVVEESSRVSLSYKRLRPNPWEKLVTQYQMGDVVQAVVTVIARFGIFARLDEGVEGLIHVSSINAAADSRKLKDHFRPGQTISVCIMNIDVARRRLGLALLDHY